MLLAIIKRCVANKAHEIPGQEMTLSSIIVYRSSREVRSRRYPLGIFYTVQ